MSLNMELEIGAEDYVSTLANLRAADKKELNSTVSSKSMFDRLVRECPFRVAWRAPNGQVGAIGGVHSREADDRSGIIWALTTPLVERYPKNFHKTATQFVDHVKPAYDRMLNFVLADNHIAKSWLAYLGFIIYDVPVPYGILRQDHCLFEWRRDGYYAKETHH